MYQPAYIDVTGCHTPADADIVAYLQGRYRDIYGQDIAFDSSDQDTEWLGVITQAIGDGYNFGLQVYNSFSPATAQGDGLSSVVKVNGISRKVATYSTQDLVMTGQAGRTIVAPVVTDPQGYIWTLSDFRFPFSGQVTVTATCTTLGAIAVPAGAVWSFAQIQQGWHSVSSVVPASVGQPVESDAALRRRQAKSTALPAQTVLDGIVGDILALPNVISCTPYENDTDTVDANGIPAHGTAFVVDGGDAAAIAGVIALKKTQGSPTYGTSYAIVPQGKASIPRRINFFRPVRPIITYKILVSPLPNYTLDAVTGLQQAMADWTNALPGGVPISINDTYEPALEFRIGGARPYKVLSITMARDGAVMQAADIPMALYERPMGIAANVNVATPIANS